MANAHLFKCLIVAFCFLQLDKVESVWIWPFPTLIGDEFTFYIQFVVSYSVVLPEFFVRRRRSLTEDTGDRSEMFDMSSREGVGFARLHSLMSWMGLEEDECQKRLLCMVSQSQNKYSPLSDLIFQHFDPRLDYHISINNETSKSHLRFYEFYEAGRKGFYPGTDCNHETSQCHKNPDTVIDWKAMRTFQLFKQSFNMKFLN